jgi:hypothetical protein
MRNAITSAAVSFLLLASSWAAAAAAPSGVSNAPPFYGDPPDANHPWAIHDRNRPEPKMVTPGTFSTEAQPGKAPADAIILFDGTDLSKWEADKPGHEETKWVIRNGAMECVPGSGQVRTKDQFGDCQLHVEWAAPTPPKGDSQGRGNSGVFLMGLVEIQVLDCYNNSTYADGGTASVYGVNPAMVYPIQPPGVFQVYDIVFRRPIYKDGQQLDPGHVTVFVNGVLVQENTTLEGPTGHQVRSRPRAFPAAGPLKLQDHGNPVRFRNVWIRPLPPRAIEGGTDGPITPEAALAKRKEIAASIRADAAKLKDAANVEPEMMRLAESLVYEKDEPTLQQVTTMANQYVTSLKALAAGPLGGKRGEVTFVWNSFKYLVKWKIVPADYAPLAEVDKIVKAQGWDRR